VGRGVLVHRSWARSCMPGTADAASTAERDHARRPPASSAWCRPACGRAPPCSAGRTVRKPVVRIASRRGQPGPGLVSAYSRGRRRPTRARGGPTRARVQLGHARSRGALVARASLQDHTDAVHGAAAVAPARVVELSPRGSGPCSSSFLGGGAGAGAARPGVSMKPGAVPWRPSHPRRFRSATWPSFLPSAPGSAPPRWPARWVRDHGGDGRRPHAPHHAQSPPPWYGTRLTGSLTQRGARARAMVRAAQGAGLRAGPPQLRAGERRWPRERGAAP
jgi:hypothetical protein